MDKEKEIEEMAEVLAVHGCGCYETCRSQRLLTCSNDHIEDCAGRTLGPIARDLYNAGYGNVKQALINELKLLKSCFGRRKFKRRVRLIIEEVIDEHIKRLVSEDSNES